MSKSRSGTPDLMATATDDSVPVTQTNGATGQNVSTVGGSTQSGSAAGFPGPDRIPASSETGGAGRYPITSNAGGKPAKGKGPRKPRSPARTVQYCERLFGRFDLETRKAMLQMLKAAVCEPTLPDGAEQP